MSTRDPRPKSFWMTIWGLLFAVGLIAWLFCLTGAQNHAAWRALLVNFCFFTPLSAGLVVWSAIVVCAKGKWTGKLEALTLAGIGFAIPSLLLLLALWAGAGAWAPWAQRDFHQGAWLYPTNLFLRDLGSLLLFWILAWVYAKKRAVGGGHKIGPYLVFVYCVVFSLLGFDLVMALDPHWYSALFGAYFFITGLYIAAAAWALASVWQSAVDPDRLHDVGKLLFAFSILSTYMMYAQLLPIYYENLPHETIFAIPRMNLMPWKAVSYALVALIYLGPLVLLLTQWAKRNRWYLGTMALIILAVMWVERLWLVMPLSQPRSIALHWADLAAAVTVAALAGLSLLFARRTSVFPTRVPTEDE